MQFKIGDSVRFLDQEGDAKVVGIIDDKNVTIEDESGFEYPYPIAQLVAVNSRVKEQIAYDKKPIIKQEEKPAYKAFNDDSINHVDIHAHRLISNPEAYSLDYILDIQLNAVKAAIRKSIQQKAKSLVIIHGEGKGSLKNKVRKQLIEFREIKEIIDASYEKFGKGATEVFFR